MMKNIVKSLSTSNRKCIQPSSGILSVLYHTKPNKALKNIFEIISCMAKTMVSKNNSIIPLSPEITFNKTGIINSGKCHNPLKVPETIIALLLPIFSDRFVNIYELHPYSSPTPAIHPNDR